MTIACVVHWYESLLFLAPVAFTVAAIWVTSKITERRELREAADDTRQMADLDGQTTSPKISSAISLGASR